MYHLQAGKVNSLFQVSSLPRKIHLYLWNVYFIPADNIVVSPIILLGWLLQPRGNISLIEQFFVSTAHLSLRNRKFVWAGRWVRRCRWNIMPINRNWIRCNWKSSLLSLSFLWIILYKFVNACDSCEATDFIENNFNSKLSIFCFENILYKSVEVI